MILPGFPAQTIFITNHFNPLYINAMKHTFLIGQIRIIRVRGENRHDFLNRMTTNDLRNPGQKEVIPTLLTTDKGRVIDLLWYLERSNEGWLITSPGMSDIVYERLDRFLFPLDQAELILEETVHDLTISINQPAHQTHQWCENEGQVAWSVNDWFPGGEMRLSPAFLQEDEPLSEHEFHLLRIRNGTPWTQVEMNGEYHVQELGLLWAVDFSKGCYPGQEVVARIYNYEKNQRQAVLLHWKNAGEHGSPAELITDGKPAGVMTSVLKTDDGHIGFGLVRERVIVSGGELSFLADDTEIPVTYQPFPMRQPRGHNQKASF